MLSRAPTGVRVEFDVPATMRDGATLRANVYRPDDAAGSGSAGEATYPVLLTRLPYGKDFPLGSSALDPAQAARRGYIVVVQDTRGCFTSEGEWFPLAHEGPDGVDTVAWASSLPGANGQVAMYGASYFGHTQWAAATNGAQNLRAMAPFITWARNDEPAIRDGVLELG
ncbi:MAG TPA: CocE/NonD family hydrolase, partial [Ktedonobacterales bacterium]|nr:CocE/NonD family hydrolase [Ktedonobacterales bacterium]